MLRVYSVQEAREKLLKRNIFFSDIKKNGQTQNPEIIVRKIVEDVKQRGDDAIRDWTLKLDKVDLDEFEIKNINFEKVLNSINPKLRKALEIAANRIYNFYKSQPVESWMNFDLGGQLGQIIKPIGRVGLYIPGGNAPLISSILMTAIPAIIAGTKELIITSPPNQAGLLSKSILATCGIIKRLGAKFSLYRIGGAQAIAAMAFGTDQVPKVDKIVGAGNIFVNLAKKEVYGVVGIDGIYGPTEAIIIADQTASPSLIAADLIAQAEHDTLAVPIVITSSQSLSDSIILEFGRQINDLKKKSVVQESIRNNGGIILTPSIRQSIELSNEFAPEHLTLMVKEPNLYLDMIENAGGIFIGEYSFEVLGDYIAGPSHVMPTNGTARYSSALSVNDFIKRISYVNLDKKSAIELSEYAIEIAKAENLSGHASSAQLRILNYTEEIEEDSLGKKSKFIKPIPTIQKLLKSQTLGIESYFDEQSQENKMIYLDKNENPFVPSIGRIEYSELLTLVKQYPDPNANEFLNCLALKLNINSSYLLAGSGSDELLDLIIRTYTSENSMILGLSPSFSMYEFYARVNGANYEAVTLMVKLDQENGIAKHTLDQPSFVDKAKKAKIILLARPNNPDGMLLNRDFIIELLELNKLIIIDEAYIDFSNELSLLDLIPKYENLILSRSFSKSYSLAGLRLGYIIANPQIINILKRIKSPYTVNNIALKIGSLLLNNSDKTFENIAKIKKIREKLFKDLAELRKKYQSFYYYPSEANFVLLEFQSLKFTKELYEYFLKNNIKLRKFEGNLSNCLRVSIGTRVQMQKLIEIFQSFLRGR